MLTFQFTPLAMTLAARWATVEAVLAQVKTEIAELELSSPSALVFHSVWIGGDHERSFYVSPLSDGTGFEIDASDPESHGPLDEGPFKGREVFIPTPASKGRA